MIFESLSLQIQEIKHFLQHSVLPAFVLQVWDEKAKCVIKWLLNCGLRCYLMAKLF